MLYRKTPRQPPKLLLRVVAAGAGAALLAACSSSGETRHCDVCGTIALPASDAAADGSNDSGPMGDDAQMSGGGVMVNPEGGPMGLVDGGSD